MTRRSEITPASRGKGRRMTIESNKDKLSRVRQMSTGDPTWDLSPNDLAALKYVSDDNARLRAMITEIQGELYGQGFEILGWHANGDTEPLDGWFDNNGWTDVDNWTPTNVEGTE